MAVQGGLVTVFKEVQVIYQLFGTNEPWLAQFEVHSVQIGEQSNGTVRFLGSGAWKKVRNLDEATEA